MKHRSHVFDSGKALSRRTLLGASATGLTLLTAALPRRFGSGQAQAAEPARGGTLSFSIAAEPPTYDPHGSSTFAVIQRLAPHYSTLLRFKDGDYPTIVGDVAESWTNTPDHLTYTFKLLPGIHFHDGTAFTAADVKATYDRIRNPPSGVVSTRQSTLGKVASIETPDPLTVVFHLKEVDAAFIESCASPWNVLYSAAQLQKDPTFPAHNVMGTGPFRFVEHVAGSHWVGARFDGYFRAGQPYLDGFRAITMGPSATLSALQGKQIQADFRGFSPSERDQLVRGMGKDAHVQESNWLLHMDLSFNPKRKPFDDVRVRRALSLAIDRWGASKSLGRISVLRDVGGVMLPGGKWGATEDELLKLPGFGKDMAANRAEARRLLKEAGQENMKVTLLDRNILPYTTAGVYVIDQWRQIGVTVDHQQVELASYFASLNSGNFDVILDSFTDYTDDPATALVKFLSSDFSAISSSPLTDPTLDDLYAKQDRTTDDAERRSLVRQFEARVMEQSFVVPILWWHRIVVMNQSVQGWTMSPSHMIYQDLGNVSLTPA